MSRYKCPYCRRELNLDPAELEPYILCIFCGEHMENPYSEKKESSGSSYIG